MLRVRQWQTTNRTGLSKTDNTEEQDCHTGGEQVEITVNGKNELEERVPCHPTLFFTFSISLLEIIITDTSENVLPPYPRKKHNLKINCKSTEKMLHVLSKYSSHFGKPRIWNGLSRPICSACCLLLIDSQCPLGAISSSCPVIERLHS